MGIWESILLALSGVRSSKMRSFLTMLGIIIGIASVIGIVSIGDSLTNSITSSMEDFGANQIYAYVSSKESNVTNELTDSDLITDQMIDGLTARFANEITSVNLFSSAGSGQVKNGQRYANVNMTGTNADYLANNNLDLLKGSDITQRDIMRASHVAIVSDKFISKIFPPNVDPIGQKIKVRTPSLGVETFTILGVYTYKVPAFMSSFMPDDDQPTDMIIPISTAKRITGESEGYTQISIMFPPNADSYQLSNDIQEFFSVYYRNNPNFTIYSQNMAGMMDQFTTMLGTLSIAISIIAGISLLVGGIGVMNIMLVSVTERTREVGIRKALGARNSDIRWQFIIEAMILCLIGGIIGILLGLLMGLGGAALLGFPSSPSVPAIVMAVVFSMAIGVFFGFYPANKAAKLDPIDALRYE